MADSLWMKTMSVAKRYEEFVREARIGGEQAAWLRALTVLVVLAGATVIVYFTGGTMHVYPHLMYFAVVLAGMTFGRRAGAVVAVLAGFLLGPFMPLDVAAGIDQPTSGWLIRMAFFVGIGVLAGYARFRFHKLLDRRRAFTSSVSHELRTPLAAVVGFAEILETEWDNIDEAEKHELVGHIRRESFEVAHVIDDLLVAARIEGGRLHIECQDVDVRALADSLVASLGQKWSSEHVEVSGSGESWADPLRVRQIVRNLLTNAIAYGGEHVALDIAGREDTVTITVRDDGPGVPALIMPRLFEPFTNHATPTTMPHSVGLGLAVSRELAHRMGGHLDHKRDESHTVFTLELPARPTPTARPVARARSGR